MGAFEAEALHTSGDSKFGFSWAYDFIYIRLIILTEDKSILKILLRL